MSLVQVHHLEQWGRTVDARDRLGRLMAALVRATLPMGTIRSLRFLHGVATQLPGWDGEVDCTKENEYVPNGKSLWELGTGAAEAGKVRADFAKRAEAELPPGWSASETEYVAVTLAKLQNADGLAAELAEGSRYKSVKIIDAVKLCHWLDLSTPVDISAYEEITGTSVDGMQSLFSAWNRWNSITRPPIDVGLVTVGRQADVQRVQETLGPGAGLQIDADSPDEAVAFVYAALQSLDEPRKSELTCRALVISQPEAATRFPRQSSQLLILKGDATAHALRLEGEGHQVVRVHGRNARSKRRGLQLVRQPRRDFAEALKAMGLPAERAEIEARACGSSPSIWRVWNLFNEADASGVLPEWTKPEYVAVVIPVVLLGGWSESNQNDLRVVEAVTGRKYLELRDKLMELRRLDDPLVEFVADTAVISAPATAFALIATLIGREVMDRFIAQANAVFSQVDPLIDVDPDQRMYAGVNSQAARNSEWLRDGMAETLLRISVLGKPLEESGIFGSGKSSQQYVDEFIRHLPGLRENYRLLASLRDQLPVLAEAAPIPFMEALEALLQGDRDGLIRLFAESSDFGGAMHPSLLWSLETIAWDPRALGRVILILAGLDQLDPGGRLSNRPAGSIVDILLPWYPGTSATVQQRIDSLDALLDRFPDGGWKILLKLMPNAHNVASGTRRPEWKETGFAAGALVPNKDMGQLYAAYVERAITRAVGNVERITTLVDSYANFSEKHRKQLEETIENSISSTVDRHLLHPIWEALRDLIGCHRRFSDAAWALGDDGLQRLERLAELVRPQDLLARHLWLFSEHMPELPIAHPDHNEYVGELQRQRVAAVREFWRDGQGFNEVLDLARGSRYPGLVANSLIQVERRLDVLSQLFSNTCCGSRSVEGFALTISGEAYALFGDKWTSEVQRVASTQIDPHRVTTTALLGYPDSQELFTLIATLGPETESDFWARHDGIVRSNDPATVTQGVRELVKHHRARDALIAVAYDKLEIDATEVLSILDATWGELNEGLRPQMSTSLSYWIEQILDRLRGDDRVDRRAVAKIEYKYLPLLVQGLEKKKLFLHDILAEDPSFFIQVLSDLYKPDGDEREAEDQPIEERKARANYAWTLLRSWSTPPGIGPDGNFDPRELDRWVSEARTLAQTVRRVAVADQQIGHIIYHVPTDPADGAWPHSAVRTLIENLRNEDVEDGIRIEQFNSRGVTSRAPQEGGGQERLLAAQWRAWADTVGPRWPRTQAMLIDIAESWEREAAREDDDAAKNRLRFQ
jgi:hypothetical protein